MLTAILGGALVLVGILATVSTRWFAIAALIATLVAAVIGLVYAPAWYLFSKNCCKAESKNKSGYIGAASKKAKAEVKAAEVVAPVAPVATAPVVEKEEVEEAVEETEEIEEVAEEAIEEVEEAVEETEEVEEVVEEATEETAEEINE